MRSNFAQPAGGHEGLFPHAYSPTDEELLARARAWLAAGGTLVRAAYTTDDGGEARPGVCWGVWHEGVCRDSLPERIAEALLAGDDLMITDRRPNVTGYQGRKP